MSVLVFTLVINGSVYGSSASKTGLCFAKALLAKGHILSNVFFYQDGVHNANQWVSPASDEINLVSQWQTLAKTHEFALDVCVAASLRRGIIDAEQARRLSGSLTAEVSANLAKGFGFAGLGVLAEKLLTSDRVVQF